MDLSQLYTRVRTITRDLNASTFRLQDIIDFINEGVDRMKQYIPQLSQMSYFYNDYDEDGVLPLQYHSLLALYASARCFSQDSRAYEATTYMNEFEQKLDELLNKIEDGSVLLLNPDLGTSYDASTASRYVKDDYFFDNTGSTQNFDTPDDEDLETEVVVDGGTF